MNNYKILKVNGYDVVHFPIKSRLAVVKIIVNVGAIHEADDCWGGKYYGAAHFLEHMFFKGTHNKSYEQINLELARLGDTNAYTSYDKTVYHITTLKSNFGKATNLLGEMFFEAAMPIDEFNKEKGVILEECQSGLDDPGHYFWTNVIGHAYKSKPVIGTKQTIKNMKLQSLLDFKNKYYTKKNIVWVVAGDLSSKEISETINKVTSKYQIPEGKTRPVNERQLTCGNKIIKHKADQAMFAMYFKTVSLTPSTFAERVRLNTLAEVLGGGMHSILFNKIREEMGLCYNVACSESEYSFGSMIYIFSAMNSKNVSKAQDAIVKELNKVAKGEISSDLLETVKDSHLFCVAQDFQTPLQVARMADRYFYAPIVSIDEESKIVKKINKDQLVETMQWLMKNQYGLVRMN